MSDLSEIQSIVNAEYNCNLTVRTQATADLNTTSRVIHQELDKRLFSMAVKRICGSFDAAVMLQQLFYWEPRATVIIDGVRWIKKSAADWEKELDLSRRDMDRANAQLLKAGFIEIDIKRWRNKFKSPSQHYRITDQARPFLIAPVQNEQVVTGPQDKAPVQTVHMPKPKEEAYVQSEQVLSKAYVQTVQVTESTKDTEKKGLSPYGHEASVKPKEKSSSVSGGVLKSEKQRDEYEAIWKATLKKHKRPCPEKLSVDDRSKLDHVFHYIRTEMKSSPADVLDVIFTRTNWFRFTELSGGYNNAVFMGDPKPGLVLTCIRMFAYMFTVDPDENEGEIPETFLETRQWWMKYLTSSADLRHRFAKDLKLA
jgi:hypothetical protein